MAKKIVTKGPKITIKPLSPANNPWPTGLGAVTRRGVELKPGAYKKTGWK